MSVPFFMKSVSYRSYTTHILVSILTRQVHHSVEVEILSKFDQSKTYVTEYNKNIYFVFIKF